MDGDSNFSAWKARVVLFLKESELWDIVESTVANPVTIPSDAIAKATYEKNNIKAQWILLYTIKDQVIPHIIWKHNVYDM